ncbi:hypothetical protein BD779DRAFT_1674324 [Infundibulicybe gibba]|nr:hypothetical protein BD779DRAFT_1674324 [Infundibulicybe gibba]
MSHTILNFEFKTSVGPSTGVLPSPVVSQDGGAAPTNWHIERISDKIYRIWTEGHHAVDDNDFVFLAGGRMEEWIINHWPDFGPNVYSIAKANDERRGWVLENGAPGTTVQCVTLPPTGSAMWVIQPALA